MTTPNTTKAPAGVLQDLTGEGLNSPFRKKKESSTMVPKSAAVHSRIALDHSTVVAVDPIVDHVEVTVTWNSRIRFGLALDPTEARKLASALLDASAPAFGYADAAEIDEHVAVARKAVVPMSPAKAAKQMREAQR